VIRNALDLDAIRDTPVADWPGGWEGPRVLFAGRLASQKNVLTFIQALALLQGRRPFSALVLGEGPDAAAAQSMVAETGLGDRVHFVGYRDDIWGLMKAATLFVSPSRFEGHPNVVLEAAACGTPLIVSDIPEHREFLDATTATLVPPEDAAALANALDAALGQPDQARARAKAGGRLAEVLGIERAVAAYDEVYQAVRRTA
jgi:glycosyltransferase involved in cell wall biosynthesis